KNLNSEAHGAFDLLIALDLFCKYCLQEHQSLIDGDGVIQDSRIIDDSRTFTNGKPIAHAVRTGDTITLTFEFVKNFAMANIYRVRMDRTPEVYFAVRTKADLDQALRDGAAELFDKEQG